MMAGRWVRIILLLLVCGPGAAFAASISAPLTSASGTFNISWTAGYDLRLADVNWRIAAAPVNSYAFKELPPGHYRFMLGWCAWVFDWELGFRNSCSLVARSERTVVVTGAGEAPIEDAATAGGSSALRTGVGVRGNAEVGIPIRVPAGVHGVTPELSLIYDSARAGDRSAYVVDDLVGYGWRLSGIPSIQRCRVGRLTGGSNTTLVQFDSGDPLCLDGIPLQLVNGRHWSPDAEYRLATNPRVKVTLRNRSGFGEWFEVRYPDGAVARFGDTKDSRVRGSGVLDPLAFDVHQNPVLAWGLADYAGAPGGRLSVRYRQFDGYGMLQPEVIGYAGVEVRLRYAAREDLPPLLLNDMTQVRRTALLTQIDVAIDARPVREYRLRSAPDAAGRALLEAVQECGYTPDGMPGGCLAPIRLGWAKVNESRDQEPVVITSITDGLGATTRFTYRASTDSTLGYAETPFGAVPAIPDSEPARIAVVAAMQVSDALGSGGFRRWNYRYRGPALRSTRGYGLLGYPETRSTDEQRGVVSYSQVRLDWPFIGRVSQLRGFEGRFGSHRQELVREEHAFIAERLVNGAADPYQARSARWHFEGSATVGVSLENLAYCRDGWSGTGCLASGTRDEGAHALTRTTIDATSVLAGSHAPAFWGDVPVRVPGPEAIRRTVTEIIEYEQSAQPWVRDLVRLRRTSRGVPGQPTRTSTESLSYVAGSRLVSERRLDVGDLRLERRLAKQFDAAQNFALRSETLSGADVLDRTWHYGTIDAEGRYLTDVTNPLGQTSSQAFDDRFGEPRAVRDPDGRTRIRDYDAFGRVERIVAGDGSETVFSYERCDQADCSGAAGSAAVLKITRQSRNGRTSTTPTEVRYYDALGREVLLEVETRDAGVWQRTRKGYDSAGRLQYQSTAALEATPSVCSGPGSECTWYSYDVRDRVTLEERPEGGRISTTYSGAQGKTTRERREVVATGSGAGPTLVRRAEFDLLGLRIRSIEAPGTAAEQDTRYTYDSDGRLLSVLFDGRQITSVEYDAAGNRTRLTDSTSGTTSYAFNAFGEVISARGPDGRQTRFEYDAIGRLLARQDPSGEGFAWRWDPTGATGQLGARSGPGFQERFVYDTEFGRLLEVTTRVDVAGVRRETARRTYTYDDGGRLASQRFPNGVTVNYHYAASGILDRLSSNGLNLLELSGSRAAGGTLHGELADGRLRSRHEYDAGSGKPLLATAGTTIEPSSIQELAMSWQSDGSLAERVSRRGGISAGPETIDSAVHDARGRLARQVTSGSASRALTFGYGDNGALQTIADAGAVSVETAFEFGQESSPFRLTGMQTGAGRLQLRYDARGNVVAYDSEFGPDRVVEFDDRSNLTQVRLGTQGLDGSAIDEFWYDSDDRRFLRRETWWQADAQQVRSVLYIGGDYQDEYISVGANDRVQRIDVAPDVRLVRWRDRYSRAWSQAVHYLQRDPFGSIESISDAEGESLVRLSYDPFGDFRAEDGSGVLDDDARARLADTVMLWGGRGFAGHEHLLRTGLVHMNRRVYDPRLARFLSPDPLVQAPALPSAFDRYAYVQNAPLGMTDPSGFCSQDVGVQLSPCKDFDEYMQVIGTGIGSPAGGVSYLNPEGGWLSGPGAIGGGLPGASISGLLPLPLAAPVPRDPSSAPAAAATEGPVEVVRVIAAPGSGAERWGGADAWLRRGLGGLERIGIHSLFGSACVGVVLGACGGVALQTSNGVMHLMLMIGIMPGGGISVGAENVLLTSPYEAISGVGTALFVSGGVAGMGGSIGLAQGTNGVNLTGAVGYGFGFGGGVGFYYAGPVGSVFE